MDAKVLKFKLFVLERLGPDAQWDGVMDLVGMTRYRFTYLFNGRFDEFRRQEIKDLADALNIHPGVLVYQFGLGKRDMTFEDAEELGLLLPPETFIAERQVA